MNDQDLKLQTLEILEETGLNWTVKKESLISVVGAKETDSFGLFRSDNHSHLATVGSRYTPYQNYELAEALLEATSMVDMKISRGGELNEGKRVYLQAELPDVYIGKSDMKRWITGLGSHGLNSVALGSTGTVVVCQNTYLMAYGELSKFRHTKTIKERVLEFVEGMKKALRLDNDLVDTFKVMATSSIKDDIFADVLKKCFEVELDSKPDSISTRKRNQLKSVERAISTELELEGATLWGLFNGITRYTNHIAVAPEKRTEYIMDGKGYDTNLMAYKTIRAWMEDHNLLAPSMVN